MSQVIQTSSAPAEVGFLDGGSLAQRFLAAKGNVQKMRGNANTLLTDEWKLIDKATVDIFRARATMIPDFQSKGLLKQINGMAASYFTFDQVTDMLDAEVSMRAGHVANQDNLNFVRKNIPLPFIHKDFTIDLRALEESRRGGTPLDTTAVETAAKKVTEKAEEICAAGITYIVGGETLYGVFNHTNINAVTLSTYGNWDASAGNGALVMNCVNAMIQGSIGDNCYGPWGLYVPTAYASVINKFVSSTNPVVTIGEAIQNLVGFSNNGNGKAIQYIRPHAKLASNSVILVPLDPTQVQIIEGLPITNVLWNDTGGLTLHFKVMAIYVPYVRVDASTHTGIVKAA